MATSEQATQECGKCGATIYPEHLEQGKAAQHEGQLLCPFCIQELKRAAAGVANAGVEPEPLGEPLALIPEQEVPGRGDQSGPDLKQYGGGGISFDQMEHTEADYQRVLLPDGKGATRCRVFHAKLNDASMAYMTDQINAWVDAHENIVIKFVSTNIGVVEGKHADPHLIVTVFY